MASWQLFRDPRNKPSMMRVALFLWAVGGFIVWTVASIGSHTVQAFPESIAAIIATLAAGKAAQSFAERP